MVLLVFCVRQSTSVSRRSESRPKVLTLIFPVFAKWYLNQTAPCVALILDDMTEYYRHPSEKKPDSTPLQCNHASNTDTLYAYNAIVVPGRGHVMET